MKAYLIHGWGGNPQNCWFPWLTHVLENMGYEVVVPFMPKTDAPTIEGWVGKLKRLVEAGEDNILIGHSIGCQAILRYLESVEGQFGGVYLVAGWVRLKGIEEEEKAIAKPWLSTPLHWEQIKEKAKRFVAFFSTSDPFVHVSDSEVFSEQLDAKIMIDEDLGHYDDEAGITEMPQLLDEISRS